jgi:hypothetical protein
MVKESDKAGLIVSTISHSTAPLDDLVACCGWPLLLAANPRRLREELNLCVRACVLFWLDDRQQVGPTVKLMTWLRECEPRPYRVAIAHRLAEDAESLFRAAGVHSFLSATGDITAVVEKSLWPLLRCAGLLVDADVASLVHPINLDSTPINSGTASELARPP